MNRGIRGFLIIALLAGGLGSGQAMAMSKAEAKAEHVRLSEDMRRLAKRAHWRGVDRSYRSMEGLTRKDVVLGYDDHFLGAQAARELGNVTLVYRRLVKAKAVNATADVTNWIGDILRQYGEVDLIIPDRYKGETNLAVAVMPLQPDQRSTIGMAQQRIQEGRSYNGLLPGGQYTFGPHTFSVTPGGDTIVLEVSKKGAGRVSKRKAGEKAPFRFTYMGPRADVGLGWTVATDPGVGDAPGGFSGLGGRASIGFEAGLAGPFSVLVDVGYQGLSGAPSDSNGALDDLDQFDLRKDQMQIFFAWLAGQVDVGPLDVAVGPMMGFGSASVTGVGQSCIDNPASAGCSGASAQTLRYSRLDGSVSAVGAAVGVAYDVVEFGKFAGAISLNGGALSDADRWYPFGTLGFTVGPAGQEDE